MCSAQPETLSNVFFFKIYVSRFAKMNIRQMNRNVLRILSTKINEEMTSQENMYKLDTEMFSLLNHLTELL